jgi:hypothetical protein
MFTSSLSFTNDHSALLSKTLLAVNYQFLQNFRKFIPQGDKNLSSTALMNLFTHFSRTFYSKNPASIFSSGLQGFSLRRAFFKKQPSTPDSALRRSHEERLHNPPTKPPCSGNDVFGTAFAESRKEA